jgi:hypothetical protein
MEAQMRAQIEDRVARLDMAAVDDLDQIGLQRGETAGRHLALELLERRQPGSRWTLTHGVALFAKPPDCRPGDIDGHPLTKNFELR